MKRLRHCGRHHGRRLHWYVGSQASVEQFARRLFIAGVPRNQVFADVFVEHA